LQGALQLLGPNRVLLAVAAAVLCSVVCSDSGDAAAAADSCHASTSLSHDGSFAISSSVDSTAPEILVGMMSGPPHQPKARPGTPTAGAPAPMPRFLSKLQIYVEAAQSWTAAEILAACGAEVQALVGRAVTPDEPLMAAGLDSLAATGMCLQGSQMFTGSWNATLACCACSATKAFD
jgi:hypothetical protein